MNDNKDGALNKNRDTWYIRFQKILGPISSKSRFLAMMSPTQTRGLTLHRQNEISSNELNFRHLLHLEDKKGFKIYIYYTCIQLTMFPKRFTLYLNLCLIWDLASIIDLHIIRCMGCNIKLVFMYFIFFYIGVLGKIVFWMKVWSVINIMKMIWGNIQMIFSRNIKIRKNLKSSIKTLVY